MPSIQYVIASKSATNFPITITKANPNKAAVGTVLEATMEKGRGIVAGAILIHEGGAVRGRVSVRSLDARQQQDNRPVRAPSLTPRAMRIPVPAMSGESK